MVNQHFKQSLSEYSFVVPRVRSRYHGSPISAPILFTRGDYEVVYVDASKLTCTPLRPPGFISNSNSNVNSNAGSRNNSNKKSTGGGSSGYGGSRDVSAHGTGGASGGASGAETGGEDDGESLASASMSAAGTATGNGNGNGTTTGNTTPAALQSRLSAKLNRRSNGSNIGRSSVYIDAAADSESMVSDMTVATNLTSSELQFVRENRRFSLFTSQHVHGEEVVSEEMLRVNARKTMSYERSQALKVDSLEDRHVLVGYQVRIKIKKVQRVMFPFFS